MTQAEGPIEYANPECTMMLCEGGYLIEFCDDPVSKVAVTLDDALRIIEHWAVAHRTKGIERQANKPPERSGR